MSNSYFGLKLHSPLFLCSFLNCSYSLFFPSQDVLFLLQFSFFCFSPALLSSLLANTSLCNLFAGRLSLWFTVSFLNRIMINGLLCSGKKERPTLFTQARSSPCKQNRCSHPTLSLSCNTCHRLPPHHELSPHCSLLYSMACHWEKSAEHFTGLLYLLPCKCCIVYLWKPIRW